jgi:hypothetical protein
MDEDLQQLVHELRQEVCPRWVHDKVARRIISQRPATGRRRFTFALATVALVAFCCLAIWRWPSGRRPAQQPQWAGPPTTDRTLVVAQAEEVLGFMGSIMIDAGAYSEQVVLKGAVPPLQNHLETTRDKIIHLIQQ